MTIDEVIKEFSLGSRKGFLVMNKNRSWIWHRHKPEPIEDLGEWSSIGLSFPLFITEIVPDWKQSLIDLEKQK